jgi:hypothetical protein
VILKAKVSGKLTYTVPNQAYTYLAVRNRLPYFLLRGLAPPVIKALNIGPGWRLLVSTVERLESGHTRAKNARSGTYPRDFQEVAAIELLVMFFLFHIFPVLNPFDTSRNLFDERSSKIRRL